MLKVNKMNVNLLNWMHVDLETTGQAEIHDWRKPRVLKSGGIINEQQKDNWEDGIVINKASRFEVVGARKESSNEDDKKRYDKIKRNIGSNCVYE
jgi:hypothetical protein